MYLISIGFSCCGSPSKEFACNVGDLGSIPRSGILPSEGYGYPLQYSCLEKSKDRGARWVTVCPGVAESDMTNTTFPWLSWWFRWQRICLQCGRSGFNPWVRKIPGEEEMATHSSILTWETPWTEEPGGLQFMGSVKSQTLQNK